MAGPCPYKAAREARSSALLLFGEVVAPILAPALFVLGVAERLFLAVTDGLESLLGDAEIQKCLLDGGGALVAQRQVVFLGAAFVAVTLNHHVKTLVLLQELSVLLEPGHLVRANVVAVVVEKDVLDGGGEQLLVAGSGLGRPRGIGSVHGHARRGAARAAGAFGHQLVGGGVRRIDGPRAGCRDGAQVLDVDVRGIRGLPGERGGLPAVNIRRIGREGHARGGLGRRWIGLILCDGMMTRDGSSKSEKTNQSGNFFRGTHFYPLLRTLIFSMWAEQHMRSAPAGRAPKQKIGTKEVTNEDASATQTAMQRGTTGRFRSGVYNQTEGAERKEARQNPGSSEPEQRCDGKRQQQEGPLGAKCAQRSVHRGVWAAAHGNQPNARDANTGNDGQGDQAPFPHPFNIPFRQMAVKRRARTRFPVRKLRLLTGLFDAAQQAPV